MGNVKQGKKETQDQAAKYGPGRNYRWEKEDTFELTGEEFALLLNTVRMEATNPQGAPAISIVECHKVLEALLLVGIEAGIVTEAPAPDNGSVRSTDEIPFVDLPAKS